MTLKTILDVIGLIVWSSVAVILVIQGNKTYKSKQAHRERDKAKVKDAIIIIILAIGKMSIPRLQYELLKCGISTTQPALKELITEINSQLGDVIQIQPE